MSSTEEMELKGYERGLFESKVLTTLENIEKTLEKMQADHANLRTIVEGKSDVKAWDNHETRIGRIEKATWWAGGAIVVLASLASYVANLISNKV